VATYSLLGDWLRQIVATDAEVIVLVGPGGDAHTYEPTPQDAVQLARATALFENGLHFETWLDRLYESSQSPAARVVVTRRITPRNIAPPAASPELDPHVWHDPRLVKEMVREMTVALERLEPTRGDVYRRRAERYLKELDALDAWIASAVADIPTERRKLVTTHDTFGYFADRYGFAVSSVLGSLSSDVSDPSAADLAELVERIRREQVPAVFGENILNPALTEQVAREAGVTVVRTLYTDALGPDGSDGDTYLRMMRANVSAMVEALR
jgi:ABC-type Zn uptake system ZnuABC Zn-binding protein ZnuA